MKHDLLGGIVFRCCIKQTQDSGVNEVVEIDVHGEVLMNPDGDGLHERKVIEHNLVADRIRNFGSTPCCGRSYGASRGCL